MERFMGFWDSISVFALPIAICTMLLMLILAPFIVPGLQAQPPH